MCENPGRRRTKTRSFLGVGGRALHRKTRWSQPANRDGLMGPPYSSQAHHDGDPEDSGTNKITSKNFLGSFVVFQFISTAWHLYFAHSACATHYTTYASNVTISYQLTAVNDPRHMSLGAAAVVSRRRGRSPRRRSAAKTCALINSLPSAGAEGLAGAREGPTPTGRICTHVRDDPRLIGGASIRWPPPSSRLSRRTVQFSLSRRS